MSFKKKILFIHPDLNPPGGANTVGVWMLQALIDDYSVTVLTWEAFDIAEINRFYGTSFRKKDLTVYRVPTIIRYLIDYIPKDPWHYLHCCCLMRWCKMIRHQFDIVMSPNSEMDFGVKGIQYVHFPYLYENWNREVYLSQQNRWNSKLIKIIETHLRPWRLISGFSFKRMKKNLSIVNSEWTGEYFQKTYNVKSQVIFPPIPGDFPDISWQDKTNSFVCISRISSEKRLEEIIQLLVKVRHDFPDIQLHIIGSRVSYDEPYYQRIIKKVADHASWVSLKENISRNELLQLVCQSRYGIHGMENEHFGIAVAEMVRAGCITFVPDGGGQVEIVGHESRLLYKTSQEAVDKILTVMHSKHQQQALHQYLGSRKAMFSTQLFMQQIRQTVAAFNAH